MNFAAEKNSEKIFGQQKADLILIAVQFNYTCKNCILFSTSFYFKIQGDPITDISIVLYISIWVDGNQLHGTLLVVLADNNFDC